MKLKTNKSLLKRVKVTGKKKIMRRPVNQGHFNAKESGNNTRSKRSAVSFSLKQSNVIKKRLPYNT